MNFINQLTRGLAWGAPPWTGTMLFVVFVGTVVAANWSLRAFGFVPVGFGLMAPAGVYFAGLAFTLRDLLHDAGGRRAVVAAIVVGALVSAVLEDTQRIAVASAFAFLVSELADLIVYTPLRCRTWLGAVAASNVIGLTVDSALFLWIAFGSLAFIEGQIVGKAMMTLLAIVVLWIGRRAVPIRFA